MIRVDKTEERLRKFRVIAGGIGLCITVCLSSCGPASEAPRSNAPSVQANASETASNPVHVPVPKVIPVSKETHRVYQWYCAQCHGVKGHGDGINSPHLVVPPRNHAKADYLETRSDQQLFDAIKLGGLAVGRAPCMPAWGRTLDDGTIRSLVSYIRELCACKAL